MLRNKLIDLLSNKKTHWILIFLNLIVSLTVFILNRKSLGGDYATYSSLAAGLLKGNYSMYYFFPGDYPDTFRNPGYPIFLAILQLLSHSLLLPQIIQLLLYFATVYLVLKIIDLYFNSNIIKNLFLFFLMISINIVIFTPFIVPEILTSFLMILAFWLDIKLADNKYSKFFILGLLYGFIFQVRPIFLFFPFLKFLFDWLIKKKNFDLLKNSFAIVIYLLTMIPFGIWNYNHHGVFKITSLQGGAEVMNAGYWAQKIPGYYEDRSFNNIFFEEPIVFIDWKDRDDNIKKYNAEWDYIDTSSAKFLTEKDSFQIKLRRTNQYPFPMTLNSKYAIEHERIIKEVTIKDMMYDKSYVIKSKLYSAIRLWVTGVPLADFRKATITKKLILLIPMLLTGTIFLLSVFFIPLAFIKFKFLFTKLYSILILIIYYGLIHVPFVIQARYTIPVRILLLLLLSISIYHVLLKAASDEKENLKS